MNEQDLRNSIKNVLMGITGIGQVYDYERFARDWSTFLAFFKNPAMNPPVILGWEITKNGIGITKVAQKFRLSHNFVIKGYLGVNDAGKSDVLFNALILVIVQALLDAKLPGPGGSAIAMPQVDRIEPREFGAVLCHYAEIRYSLWDDTDLTPEQAVDFLRVTLDYYLAGHSEDGTPDAEDDVTLAQ